MSPDSRLDDYRWLVSDQGARWLGRVAEHQRPTVAQASRLRKDLSPGRVHLVLEQAELRRRARAKFVEADRMFFTPIGLEQATDQWVAAYKASRAPEAAPLADLCCGIGGDLLALARRGPVVGVERDPAIALLAQANLRAVRPGDCDGSAARVRVEDVAKVSACQFAAWHLDPDRRPGGRRTTSLERCQPGPATIDRLLRQRVDAAVKLAPATQLPQEWSGRAELEWISRDRQCRQLVAWFGALAEHPGKRRATIVGTGMGDDSHSTRTLVGTEEVRAPVTGTVRRYVFDPDAAVLAARLLGTLAAEHGLAQLAAGVGYLTGDRPTADPALACFEVCDVLPFDLKRLKRLLEGRGIGRLEIKKRGVPNDPDTIHRRLHLQGDGSAVLLLTRIGQSVTAIIASRCQ